MSSSVHAWSRDSAAIQLLWPHLRPRRFAAGELLWREGDPEGLLVVLEKGTAKAYRTLPDGRPVTLYLFGPGDVFGFIPLLDGSSYPASVQALEAVEARVISRAALQDAIRERPDLALMLISVLGRRLREAFDRIQGLSSRGVLSRVATALEALAESGERRHPPMLRLPVSAAEFAHTIGISPETFSRAVTRLCKAGILRRLGGGAFQLLDAARLREAAEVVEP